jgi:hypothetical protein
MIGEKFVVGCICVALIFTLGWVGFFPKQTRMYNLGVQDTYKEAYENGLMVKEITEDDKVVYRWIELHKVGEDYERD